MIIFKKTLDFLTIIKSLKHGWILVDCSEYMSRSLYKGAAYTMKVKSYPHDFTKERLILCAAYSPEITVLTLNMVTDISTFSGTVHTIVPL